MCTNTCTAVCVCVCVCVWCRARRQQGGGGGGGGGNGTGLPPPGMARHRRRRAATDTKCTMVLDADYSFFERWRGECLGTWSDEECLDTRLHRVASKMIGVIHASDEVYRMDSKIGRVVQLNVVGTHVETEPTSLFIRAGTTSLDALKTYFNWLNKGANFVYDTRQRQWVYSPVRVRGASNQLEKHVPLQSRSGDPGSMFFLVTGLILICVSAAARAPTPRMHGAWGMGQGCARVRRSRQTPRPDRLHDSRDRNVCHRLPTSANRPAPRPCPRSASTTSSRTPTLGPVCWGWRTWPPCAR